MNPRLIRSAEPLTELTPKPPPSLTGEGRVRRDLNLNRIRGLIKGLVQIGDLGYYEDGSDCHEA